ncbi:MAG: T9SS type A sorting domain-containing protein [Flavobacteriales bacterium]|nr:T9SS type A sorting domain-containing protein [Flavobacteriales bacterium]
MTRTGSNGGTYSATPSGLSINSSTGEITLGTSSAGTYTVTYSIAASGGCAAFSTTASVVVDTAPSATISYSGSPFCTSGGTANVTRTGSTGGAYSATPSGLSINSSTGAIDLGASTAGNYTVTYSIPASGGCAVFSTTASVVISSAPSAAISYAGSPFCSSTGTVNVARNGTSGGTYSATPSGLSINSSTGAINLTTSTAGSYTVTYSVSAAGGCAAFSTTAPVVISTAPSATINYVGSPYCTSVSTASVTQNGSTGGTYSATPAGLSINSSTGAINPGASSAGTYTVTYSIAASGGCAAFSTTAAVVIKAAPTATIAYTGAPYCTSGGTANVTRTGNSGGTYSATPSGLVIDPNSGTINLGASAAASYTVTYSIAASGGCSTFSTTAVIVVGQAPTAAITYPGSPYCASGSMATVSLSGTSGGSFTASPSGLAINAGSGTVDLGASVIGTYTVTYSIAPNGGCSAYSTTTQISIGAAPSASIVYSGTPFCASQGQADVTRTGSSGGVFSAIPAGLVIDAATGSINLATSTVGNYTVMYAIAAAGGCSAFSTTTPVSIGAAPSATISYGGSPYCTSGGSVTVNRTGTPGGVFSATPSGLSLNGATGAINLASSAAGTYTVTYAIAAGGGCTAFSTSAGVVVNQAPSASIIYTGSPYCSNEGTVGVAHAGTAGGTYSASPAGLTIDPNSGVITLGTSSAGTYTVSYTIAAGSGCAAFTTSASVVVSEAPSASINYDGSPYCSGSGTANVNRIGTVGGTYDAAPGGLSINASSGAIDLGSSTAGTYTVTYSVAGSGGCAAFSTTTPVVVGTASFATIGYSGTPYCSTDGVAHVTRSGSAGGAYSAVPTGLALNSATGDIDLSASTAGTYTVTYSIAASGGCDAFSTTAEVEVDQASVWYADADGDGAGDPLNTLLACEQPIGYVAVAGDDCPNDPAKVEPGVCGCGTADTDTDGDGIPDCIDSCPLLPGEIGDACDDGDPNTVNDAYDANCNCVGEALDCEGVPGGSATIGSACDDGDANTVGDVYGSDCVCAGQLTDCEGVPGGSATIGTACDDGDATTGNDVYDANCNCVGEALDCLGVPGGSDTIGSACDDGDTTTGNDVYDANCNCVGEALDCLGVPGGSATIGTPCDDGDANTGGDIYGNDCVCAGQLYDCEGVPGGSATIGTACDDGDATTGNDVYDANCNCAGEVLDCLGVPGGPATVGTACDDGDATTGNDVYDANCNCVGEALDCLGVPGGSATIGSTCDDGDPNTVGDIYGSDCVCAGQLSDCEGVPGGSATIGTACDDGDATTGNDVYDANCNCVGEALDCEGVPGGTATIGSACDDGDATTGNDVYDANCNCVGEALDCEGVPGGTATIGSACDDGDTTTGNDVYDANCNCVGEALDCEGVPGGTATIGSACDDGDPNTVGDTYGSDCICAGTVGYDCPALGMNIGDACDDGDANTSNDMITADCECVGTVDYDCPVLEANIGDACDDGDANTSNDVITADCECAGTVIYDCPVLEANIGDACDDGDANTSNDQVTANCECMGTVSCVPPTITGTTSDSPICTGTELNLGVSASGTGPLSYAWSGAGSFSPSPLSQHVAVSGAATGTYQVTVSNSCGSANATVTVVVNAAPSATIEYEGSPYCTTSALAQVTLFGTQGGSYVSAPSGLEVDPVTGTVDLDASTAGTYTVTYSIDANGGCAMFTTTAEIVVEEPTVWYADLDGDGVGSDADAVVACEQPSGYVATSGDACPDDPNKLEPGACGCGIPDTDTDGDGTADCIDGCPTDPNKIAPGACGCGIPDIDSDGDGIADCIDSCPSLPGEVGDACDDNDPVTQNDVITSDCVCVGTIFYDCPDLEANVGDACDDGDASTENDVVTADCSCAGTSIYDCPDLEANVGDACDDGDATTENDMVTVDCACVGTSIYDCPDLEANFGDTCDDGDTLTVDDMITEDCICQGDIHEGIIDQGGTSGVSVALFPNPNRTGLVTLHIEGLAKDASTVLVEVHDAAGRRVYQATVPTVGGTLDHRMDLSGQVSQGLYMVKASVGVQRYLQRLVIQ